MKDTNSPDTAQGGKFYECVKCEWSGHYTERDERDDGDWITHVCPECGCEDFYLKGAPNE